MPAVQLEQMALRLALAVVFGGVVGLERQRKARGAGLRTHILVCLGATLAVTVADVLAQEWRAANAPIWLDKGRVAAGVLTGIGFLGAGTIVNAGSSHRGLTTAAMIWFVAALGTAIGMGYYALAGLGTAFALAATLLLEPFEDLMHKQGVFTLRLSLPQGVARMAEVEAFLEAQGCAVRAARLDLAVGKGRTGMAFEITSSTDLGFIETMGRKLQEQYPEAEKITFER